MRNRIILAALLIICLLFMFAACSGEKNTPLEGKYVIVDITDDPDGVTFADLDAMYKEIGQNLEDYIYLEFLAGSRFKLVMFGEEEKSGAYTQNGGALILTANGERTTAEIAGEKITWEYDNGAKLILEKN